jgi:hypothetical protein
MGSEEYLMCVHCTFTVLSGFTVIENSKKRRR